MNTSTLVTRAAIAVALGLGVAAASATAANAAPISAVGSALSTQGFTVTNNTGDTLQFRGVSGSLNAPSQTTLNTNQSADLELGVGFNGTSGAFSYEAYSPNGTDLGQFEVGVASSSSWAPHDDGASAHFITTLPGLTMNSHTHNSKYVVDLG